MVLCFRLLDTGLDGETEREREWERGRTGVVQCDVDVYAPPLSVGAKQTPVSGVFTADRTVVLLMLVLSLSARRNRHSDSIFTVILQRGTAHMSLQ